MSEKMYCSVCKTDVDPEVYDDGAISYCPICHTGYREISYAAHMRELADEHAVLSEFENETHPYLSAQSNTGLQADDGQVAAIEGGYDYMSEGYSVCPVCRSMSFFNDECQFCGFGSDDGIPPVAAKA